MFSAAHPRTLLSVMGLITLVAILHLNDLQINVSAESMLIKGTPAWDLFQRTQDTFGSDSITVVFLRDPELFDPEKLSAIGKAVQEIEVLPFVERVSSLYSIRNVKNVDGYISTRPYLVEIPATAEAIETIKQEALQNPLILRNLLSADGTAMAINIYFKSLDTLPAGFDHHATAAIELAITPLRGQIQEAFQMGGSYVRDSLTDQILLDQRRVLPLSLLVLVMTLALTLRSLNGAMLPLLTAGMSVIWTLALMALLEVPVNVMTSIIPALLIIIGSTEDIHLLAEYQAGVGEGMTRESAVDFMAANMGTAVLLTFITTYLGFLSVALNDIDLLRQFGLMAATGLLLNFLITVGLHPIYLWRLGKIPEASAKRSGVQAYRRLAGAVHRLATAHKPLTLGVVIVAVLVSGYGALSLRVNNNPMDYFGKESLIKQRADTLHDHLSGLHTFSIILDSGIDETFLQTKYLAEIQKLQTYLRRSGRFDHSFSYADFISLVHGVMAEEEGREPPGLPAADEIVREYMLFIKHRDVSEVVSDNYGQARIVVRHNIGSSYELNQAVEGILRFAGKHLDSALQVEITGEAILANQAADTMAHGQAQSLIMMIVGILLVVSVLFVNIRAGLIAVIPNFVPIAALFGVMGFAGIPLDTGTGMVAAIALGICVDDTMHFMSRYHQRLKTRKNELTALEDTVKAEAVPIITTSLALALGFATLATSSFVPVVYFGLLSAMVICLALIATFLLTPVLLSTTRLITAWDLLSVKVRRECIGRCALFRGMALWQIKKVLLVNDAREYQTGELIIEQGEPGKRVFVILEGRVEIRKRRADGAVIRLKTMAMGEVFGEIALVSRRPRTAEVKAIEPTRVLGLSWEGLNRLSRIFPQISVKLFRNLSAIVGDRLAHADDEYITLKDSLTDVYTATYIIEQLNAEACRVDRYQEPLSVVVLSVGAASDSKEQAISRIPDAIQKQVAHDIVKKVRKADSVARWFSDVFIILLPRTRLAGAESVVERLEKVLALENKTPRFSLRLTVGAAQWGDADTVDSFLSRAGRSLMSEN